MNKWTRWTAYVAVALGLGLGFVRPALAWSPNLNNCNSKTVLTANSTLNFGSIAANSGGTVTVNPGGTYSSTGGVTLLSGTGLAPASFTLTDPGASPAAPAAGSCADYSGSKKLGFTQITVSVTGSVALYDTSGNSMMVSNLSWALCPSPGSCGTVYTTPANVQWDYASDTLYVGGMLTVGSNQVAGSYSTANAGGVPINITLTWN